MEEKEEKIEELEPTSEGQNNNEKSNDSVIQEVKVEKNKKAGGLRILLIAIICILLVATGVYIVFMVKDSNTTKIITNETKKYKSEYRLTGNGLEDFDIQFLKLENNSKNTVYSPLSIKYALEMLGEGANGNTKSQIDDIIGDYTAKKYVNGDHMSFANAMFIKNSYKDSVKDAYISNLANKYNAEVIYDSFDNPNNMNKWVSDNTFNLINNLVDDVSSNDFFLINALAIDMNWNNQIHCRIGHKIPCVNDGRYEISYLHEKLDDDSKTNYGVVDLSYSSEKDFYGGYNRKNEFNGKEGTKGATVLADFNKYDIIKDLGEDKIRKIIKPEYEEWLKTEDGKNDKPYEEFIEEFIKELKENYGKSANSTDFLVHEDGLVKVFAKDLQEYDGTTLQYIGVMPKKEELSKFIKNTNKQELNKIINNLKEVNIDSFEEGYATRIRGFIPFFKFEYELSLINDLKEMGITDVFDDTKADLSNLSKGAVINKAIHKANIEFSNDGIRASAATAEGGAGSTGVVHFEHLFKVPVKEIDVTFNKPYMYLIRDKKTGEVWFVGTVYEGITK